MPTVISGATLNALTTVSWGVISLFANNEQGVWFDPSDFLPNWRRNFFRYSEDFSNTSVWAKSPTATVTTGQIDPLGGTTAAKIEFASIFQWHGQSYTFSGGETVTHSLWLRGDTAGTIGLTDASGGAWNKKVTISTSWQRFDVTATSVPAAPRIVAIQTQGGDLTTVYVAFEQLDLGSSATAYQKITDGIQDYLIYQPQPVMFTDAAGKTPVTAVEQPVGLILDKSKGLVLGSEIITPDANRDFSSDTGYWTKGTGATISGGTANFSSAFGYVLYRGGVLPVGTLGSYYEVTFTVSNYVSGSIRPYFGGTPTFGTAVSANGTYNQRFCPTSGTEFGFSANVAFTGSIDNISVKQVLGNHANQSTDASRPVLSARVNQLTYTDGLRTTEWPTLSDLTRVVSGGGTPSTGFGNYTRLTATAGNTGHYLQSNNITFVSGVNYTISFEVQYVDHRWVGLSWFDGGGFRQGSTFDLLNGVVGSNLGENSARSITPLGGNRYRISISRTATTTGTVYAGIVMLDSDKLFTTVTSSNLSATIVDIGLVDLRPTNSGTNLPPYQRVGGAVTATTNPAVTGVPDYDTNGFPLYLRFDGVDDFLVTSTIDPGAVNKAQIFSGMRRTAATDFYQCFFETSSTTDINNGVVAMFGESAAAGARVYGQSRGTIALQAYPSSGVFPNITTNVLAVQSDISAPILSLRSNGTSVASTISSQGTGNYLAYPLYIGRRGGTTFPASMQLYNLILRFSATNLETPFIQATETYINSKTKAY